jgi:hypothetical protein
MKKHIIFIFIVSLLFIAGSSSVQGEPVNPQSTPKNTNINFIVKWDGKIIPGITKVSGLRRKTEIVEHRSGGDQARCEEPPEKPNINRLSSKDRVPAIMNLNVGPTKYGTLAQGWARKYH